MIEKAMGFVVALMFFDVVYMLCTIVSSMVFRDRLIADCEKEKNVFKWLEMQELAAKQSWRRRRNYKYAVYVFGALGYICLLLMLK